MASLQGTTVNNFLRTLEQIRATGWYGAPTGSSYTGLATEMGVSSGQGYILCYNRDSGSYGVLNLSGSASNLQISGSNINVTSGALQQGGNQVLHAGNYTSYPDTTKLPLAGGTMTGVLTTYTPGVQTSLSAVSAFNAGVNVGERSVTAGVPSFVPAFGQTTLIASQGYRSHMVLGSYRNSSANWAGGPFIAWGGNDSYPTEYWLFNQGGAITHSSGTTFLNNNSSLTAGNLSGTIPSAVLGNSAHFIGTTSIALNRASAAQSLTGVNIDGSSGSCTGNAATVTNGAYLNTAQTFTAVCTFAVPSRTTSYTTPSLQVYTGDNTPPGIAFHRGGYSATYLYENDGELYTNPWTTRGQTGKLLAAGNYTDYTVTKTGTGASGSWGISVTGNAANVTGTVAVANGGTGVATSLANTFFATPNGSAGAPSFRAIVAADVPTLNQSTTGNAATATNLTTNRTNWSTNGTISAVVGQLSWKHYGNNHTIIDASNSTAPDGTAINNTNSGTAWSGTYPTLMGWNGSTTYGVRVDSCRLADSATSATSATTATTTTGNAGSVTYLPNRTDATAYPVVWGAAYTNGSGTIAYSCAAVTIQSSTGTLAATSFSGAGTGLTGTASSLSIGGNAANVTGTVAIANGGTGATTAAQARTNLGIGTGSGTVTSVSGTGTVSGITLSGTVTTSGNLTLGGSLSGTASSLTAGAVTDGVYLSTTQTISGVKTFSSAPIATNIAKAWVHFNGTSSVGVNCTINASYNVSSVAHNATGDYTVNFTSALVDANYVVAGTVTIDYTSAQSLNQLVLAVPRQTNAQAAGSCRLACEYIHGASLYDAVAVRAVFYR